jgi:predicted Zn-dependent protease
MFVKLSSAYRYRTAQLFILGLVLAVSSPAWARYQIPPPCKNAFTVEQEQEEGAKYAKEIFKQMPVLPDNSPLSQYVRSVGDKLVNVTPGYRWPFNFHVVASDEINAFALPGGAMFVNVGAINAAETEAQLAGVMAHELSHVVLRHSTCNMTKQQAPKMWAGLGQLAAGVLLGNGALGSMASQGIGMAAGLTFLRMSRDDEKQADLLGAGILYDAGYDPRGLPQFFETIEAKYGAGGAQIFSDHPNPGNRMQYIKDEIASLPPRSRPIVTTAAFTKAKALAVKEKVYTGKEIEAGGWRGSGKYALLPGGPATIIPTAQGQAAAGSSGSAATGRLARASLGLNDRMTAYQGTSFSMNYPSSWQKGESQNGSVAFVPPNGAGDAGIAYGAIVDGAKLQQPVRDQNSLNQATSAIARQLAQQNGGMQQASDLTTLTVGGQPATAVELRGRSPIADGNQALVERDLLVTIARPDGAVTYVIFVSPDADYQTLKPLYNSMIQSLRVR